RKGLRQEEISGRGSSYTAHRPGPPRLFVAVRRTPQGSAGERRYRLRSRRRRATTGFLPPISPAHLQQLRGAAYRSQAPRIAPRQELPTPCTNLAAKDDRAPASRRLQSHDEPRSQAGAWKRESARAACRTIFLAS